MDVVATRHGAALQGATAVALTKMDVLSDLEEIPVCVGYRLRGEVREDFPFTPELDGCEPVYEVLPGWKTDISAVRDFSRLPAEAQAYVLYLEQKLGCPIRYVSVGAERDQIILR
jgi:adenylosuccinate synthase